MEFVDDVVLGDLVIKNQSYGGALIAQGFADVDGILGYVVSRTFSAARNVLTVMPKTKHRPRRADLRCASPFTSMRTLSLT